MRVGILGLGRIARKFCDDLKLVPGVSLVSVGSSSIERAQAFAAEYGADYAAGSYEALIDGPPLDLVYIATTHNSHRELTMLCLNRGVAVLCEKPMGMHLDEVKAMVAAARERKVYLMEALWTRFLPSFKEVKSLIEDGRIGEIQGLRADFGFKLGPHVAQRILDTRLGGGALLDIGIYPLFLAYSLLGPELELLSATARFHESEADIDDTFVLRNPAGKHATLHCTMLARTKTEAVIYGTESTIFMEGPWYKHSDVRLVDDQDREEHFPADRWGWGYTHEIEAVAGDLAAGRLENPMWSLEDSLRLHDLIQQVADRIGLRYTV